MQCWLKYTRVDAERLELVIPNLKDDSRRHSEWEEEAGLRWIFCPKNAAETFALTSVAQLQLPITTKKFASFVFNLCNISISVMYLAPDVGSAYCELSTSQVIMVRP